MLLNSTRYGVYHLLIQILNRYLHLKLLTVQDLSTQKFKNIVANQGIYGGHYTTTRRKSVHKYR